LKKNKFDYENNLIYISINYQITKINMSSASTKIYQCSTCGDNINYNRKQFFKHIKTPEHIERASFNRLKPKIKSAFSAAKKNPKQSSRRQAYTRFRRENSELVIVQE